MPDTIVLLSGGQDSTTSLYWAIRKWGRDDIRTVAFDYGQKHKIELQQAEKIAKDAKVIDHIVLPVPALKVLGGAALTDESIAPEVITSEDSGNVFAKEHHLPSTFVPGRNMLFLTLAAAWGAQFGSYNLVTGVCEADDAGYPDCRAVFIDAARDALRAALDEPHVHIHAPLIFKSKKMTFSLAEDLGILDIIVNDTHTCYNGVHDEDHKHDWGYGCGHCGACQARKEGWDGFQDLKVGKYR